MSVSKGSYYQIGKTIFYTDRWGLADIPSKDATYTGFTVPDKVVKAQQTAVSTKNNVTTISDAIKFTITSEATLTAYIGATDNEKSVLPNIFTESGTTVTGTTLTVYNGSDTSVESNTVLGTYKVTLSKSNIYKIVIKIPSSGTYYFGDTDSGKMCIYSLIVE